MFISKFLFLCTLSLTDLPSGYDKSTIMLFSLDSFLFLVFNSESYASELIFPAGS